MDVTVNIVWDEEASVYVAICDEIGLALESESYDTLINRVKDCVPELLELRKIPKCNSISFLTERRRVVCA